MLNKNNVMGFLLVAILVFAIPFVLAETDNDGTTNGNGDEESEINGDSTNRQVLSFVTNHGAQVRLNQLEKNIYRNILSGEAVINFIEDKNLSIDISKLYESVLALNEIKEDIENYNLSEDNETNVNDFLKFKQDSIYFTKLFREEVRLILNQNEISNLRPLINQKVRTDDKFIKKNNLIRNRIKLHNENVTKRLMNGVNLDEGDLINRIRNQEINASEIRNEVLSRVRSMQEDKQIGLFNQMRQESARSKINVKEKVENNLFNIRQNQSNRAEERLNHVREKFNDKFQRLPNQARANQGRGVVNE